MANEKIDPRKMVSMRLTEKTRMALEKKAQELGTSSANAIGVLLGALPESAFANADRAGKLIVR